MNDIPPDWLNQLKSEYPKRSGPMSWPRVFIKIRYALLSATWEELIGGVKRYARFIKAQGTEGTQFVIAPARFFEDAIYEEELEYKPAEDPKISEARRKKEERTARADQAGLACGLRRGALESVEAFETRIRFAHSDRPPPKGLPVDHRADGELSRRISSLADRLRVKA